MTTLEPRTNFRPSHMLDAPGRGEANASAQQSLTQTVLSAVCTIEEGALRPVARPDAGPAFEPRTLLALLSYCYARDIFGSEEIEDILRRDANFRQICNNEFPGAWVIRRFRRENREALHRCLTATLCALSQAASPAMDHELAQGAMAEDATRRIMKAMFIDSMETD